MAVVALAQHDYFEWLAALLVRLCKQQGVQDADIPVRPAEPAAPEPPSDHDSDLDELKRILDANPALRQGIKTGDI